MTNYDPVYNDVVSCYIMRPDPARGGFGGIPILGRKEVPFTLKQVVCWVCGNKILMEELKSFLFTMLTTIPTKIMEHQ